MDGHFRTEWPEMEAGQDVGPERNRWEAPLAILFPFGLQQHRAVRQLREIFE
jgi:hypothetical protein